MISSIKKVFLKYFQNVFESNSQSLMLKKWNKFNRKHIFEDEDLSKHFAHIETENKSQQNVLKSFIIDRINFINNNLSKKELEADTFCDMGDSDGIFLKSLGKNHLSINRSEIALKNIRKKGINGIICDIDSLPLKNGSIDHILIFETFEHLPNPIKTLQDLYRICNKSIFLSIPYVSKTNIHRYGYGPSSWPIYEHHIFEFDNEDFRKIVSHTEFRIKNIEFVEVLDMGRNIKEKIGFALWEFSRHFYKTEEYKNNENDLYLGCFKKFSIYHLIKETDERKQ